LQIRFIQEAEPVFEETAITAGAEEGEVIMAGQIMDRLKRSHFLEELTGKVHLSQFEAVSSINPELARRTLEAQRS
jgi:hypothetical protein